MEGRKLYQHQIFINRGVMQFKQKYYINLENTKKKKIIIKKKKSENTNKKNL